MCQEYPAFDYYRCGVKIHLRRLPVRSGGNGTCGTHDRSVGGRRPRYAGLPQIQSQPEPRVLEDLPSVVAEHGAVPPGALERRELVEMGCRRGCGGS